VSSRRFSPLQFAKAVLLGIVVCCLLSQKALSASQFDIVQISNALLSPVGLNNNGQLVTTYNSGDGSGPVLLWSRSAGEQTISIGGPTTPIGIDEAGDIVGTVGLSPNPQLAFFWQPGGSVQYPETPGANGSSAIAASSSGVVIGNNIGLPESPYFIWNQSAGTQLLQVISGQVPSLAGVNSSSQVAGTYIGDDGGSHAFLWSASAGLQDLGTLGADSASQASAVNDRGAVVGWSNFQIFLWTQTGGMKSIANTGRREAGISALGINNQSWVVLDVRATASLWTPDLGVIKLSEYLRPLHDAVPYFGAVNDFGVLALATTKGTYVLAPKMKMTVTSEPNPSTAGEAVTFTASMNSIAGPPPDGEIVQFTMGKQLLGTGTLSGGIAQFTTSSLKAGSHRIAPSYGGDANYNPAHAIPVKQVVR